MYIQPLEYKEIYHDVMWYATVIMESKKSE